ncbi:MAG: hypothetical protein LC789_08975 [Actinobacteria bacterium]|nr:hypothetical protein [Actinomycetota bacterium]MCA1720319.1 hypothetical protein [Actinomycetota bacterium]
MGDEMHTYPDVARLLAEHIPVALLFDIAGFGPTPEELLVEDRLPADHRSA